MLRLASISLLLVFHKFCAPAQSNDSTVLFAYFTGNGEDGLHLAISQDGYDWQVLNHGKSLLKPTAGNDKLMRDPCIIRGPDGVFRMVWTVSWGERGIGYAWSKDLIQWSEQQYIPVMDQEPQALNCWAPELIYDNNTAEYMIYWATTIPGRFDKGNGQKYNHRIYYTTTKDFITFSKTSLLYDRDFSVIDATIFRDHGKYVMILKDETDQPYTPEKNLRLAFSTRIEGPYSDPGEPITGEYWAEGPTAIRIRGNWFVYFDKYRLRSFGLITSPDLSHWRDESGNLNMPEGIRHGTVLWISSKIANRLQHTGR